MRHGRSDDEHGAVDPSVLTLSMMSPGVRRWTIYGVVAALVLLGLWVFVVAKDGNPPEQSPSAAAASVRLAGVDGSYVLAGENPKSERLYRVDGGRLRRLAAKADFAGATTVTARGPTVVVGFEDAQGKTTIRQVRDGRLRSIGIASGYAPSLSANGALAWASADTPTTDRVSVFARDSIGSRQRMVATFDNTVVGLPLVIGVDWAGTDLIVGIVRYSVIIALRFPDGRGPAETVGRLPVDSEEGGQLADFVAGGRTVVLTSELNSLRKPLDGGASGSLPQDALAECITDTDDALINLDGALRLASDTRERPVGRIPRQIMLFDVACPS